MKTAKALSLATIGLIGSASAFSLDFSAFSLGQQLNNDLVVAVPGFGNVRFTESTAPPSSLEIAQDQAPFNGISFDGGEDLIVTFEGGPVTDVNFAFAGLESGESFSVTTLSNPDDGTRRISFTGDSASLIAVSFESVPEPSSTLLVALSALGLVGRRRR